MHPQLVEVLRDDVSKLLSWTKMRTTMLSSLVHQKLGLPFASVFTSVVVPNKKSGGRSRSDSGAFGSFESMSRVLSLEHLAGESEVSINS